MTNAPSTTSTHPYLQGAQKWGLCILLFLATTLNYLDRQTLSILAPTIQRDMGFNNETLGWLFSIFYYTYTVSQFAVGLLLDRSNLRWAYGLAVLAWSVAAGLTGLANGVLMLALFRGLLGVMESANWPAAMRIVARALPPKDRPLGNGIFTSGSSVGALIAPAAVMGISALLGWRWAFAVVGSLGGLWFLVWLFFTRSETMRPVWKENESVATERRKDSPWATYGKILSTAQFWRVFAVAVLVNPCLYFNVNWLPTYFVQEWNLDEGTTLGGILTAIYLGLDAGYLICGSSILALVKRGSSVATARLMVFLAATVLMACSALVPFISGMSWAVAALVAANCGTGMWIAMYLTMSQEVSDTDVSTVAGLLGGSGSFAGAIAMWAVGKITQATSSFAAPFVAIATAAVLAALAGWRANEARRNATENG